MSSFNGVIEDIAGISIDNFENVHLAVFFLSHCHSDHMKGLRKDFFLQLQTTNKYLYCSSISKQILEHTKEWDVNHFNVIKVLDMYTPRTLTFTFNGEEISFTVTCFPSGHCPGSVMFVLEKDNLSILYTGDFRYNINDMKKMKVFKSFDGFTRKKFSKVYLDSTFLTELYPKFPSREESVEEIIKISKEWLNTDGKNVISIESSGNHGQEYIYKKLSITFSTKIHVKPKHYDVFVKMGMSDYVTNDPNVRIHDCHYKMSKKSGLPCNYGIHASNILTVIPSAIVWQNWHQTSISKSNFNKPNAKNVCYSMHSSFEELKAFIEHVHCDEIIPFVCPVSSSMDDAYKLINKLKMNLSPDKKHLPSSFNFSYRQKKYCLDNTHKSEYISSDED